MSDGRKSVTILASVVPVVEAYLLRYLEADNMETLPKKMPEDSSVGVVVKDPIFTKEAGKPTVTCKMMVSNIGEVDVANRFIYKILYLLSPIGVFPEERLTIRARLSVHELSEVLYWLEDDPRPGPSQRLRRWSTKKPGTPGLLQKYELIKFHEQGLTTARDFSATFALTLRPLGENGWMYSIFTDFADLLGWGR